MRKIIDSDYLSLLSRLLVGGMFIYAAYYKVIDPAAFAKSIWYYHLVWGKLINLMALVMPWIELTIGVALILGFWVKGATLVEQRAAGDFHHCPGVDDRSGDKH